MDCSAAKLGWRENAQSPEVMKPRSRSACLKPLETWADCLYLFLA